MLPAEGGMAPMDEQWAAPGRTLIRRLRLGVWERLLEANRARGVEPGMAFLDGTSIRAHAKAAGACREGGLGGRRDAREALGRSRGGHGAEAVVVADARGGPSA